MQAIIALIIAEIVKLFSFETVKYLAFRAFLILLVMGLGPIMIFKGFSLIMKFLGTYGMGLVNSLLGQANVEPQVVQLWGVGAFLGAHLRVGEGLSIFLALLVLKFTWGLLPKWGVPAGLVRY